MKNITFEDLPSSMQNVLDRLDSIEKELQLINKKVQSKESEELLTRKETIQLLKIAPSTLWKLTKSGKLKAYGLGTKIYYKKSDILNSLVKL